MNLSDLLIDSLSRSRQRFDRALSGVTVEQANTQPAPKTAPRVDSLSWHPFTVDQEGGYKVRDLAALHNGERPADLGLSEQEIDRRWSLLGSDVKDTLTMATKPPEPTGQAPTVLSRDEVIKRVGTHPAPSDAASPSPSTRSGSRPSQEPDRESSTSSDQS